MFDCHRNFDISAFIYLLIIYSLIPCPREHCLQNFHMLVHYILYLISYGILCQRGNLFDDTSYE